jgi:hypothetical protein
VRERLAEPRGRYPCCNPAYGECGPLRIRGNYPS